MGISEKVAYLKGLMEGMNLNADSNEGKLFLAIADVLDEIALEVEDLTDEVMELGDGLAEKSGPARHGCQGARKDRRRWQRAL